jgi:Na+-transporting NADH:ubiquinone oxidoreductase subunit B
MKFIEKFMSSVGKPFQKKGPLEKFYPLYEAIDTFVLTPGKLTQKAPHVRDSVDLKRVMVFVIIALIPATLMGIYNTGYQMLTAQNMAPDFWKCVVQGASKVLPIIAVSYAVGGFWEVLFAVVRKHEINEGLLVTGLLFPLVLPPTIPLWMVAVGISFGVVIGKEIFGGTGFNVFNPALLARACLFFAYPAQMSGAKIWVAVDGYTRATPLAVTSQAVRGSDQVQLLADAGYNFHNLFFGLKPGSIGETSVLACLIGLVFLLVTRVANWKIIISAVIGLVSMSLFLSLFNGPGQPAYFAMPFYWHFLLGGFAFGAIFMATDPVSAPATKVGQIIYGFLIGLMTVLIRVFNPAYPEGVMLSILFMNVFASAIDYFVMTNHITARNSRNKSLSSVKV